jgi:hypothetical protein
MPLRLKPQAEPFTDYSKGKEPILATSDEYDRLRRDLERYTDGLIQGRSYLIAGHRGSGKTMLVHKAIEDVVRNSVKRESRPLLVRLHGPDLLPVLAENNGTKPVEAKPPAAAPAPAEKKEAPAKPDPDVAADGAEADPDEEPASNGTDAAAAAETKKQIQTLNELDIVLTQMMKSLFRDVANEYRRCYREKILRLDKGIKRSELLELAAQFDLELTEYLTPSRLRAYWRRIDAFEKGILLAGNRANYKTYDLIGKDPEILPATDIGLQEILVLSLLSQAFQVISGTVEEKKKETDAAKNERSSSLTTAYALNNLFAPIAGLLTGGFVGISLGKDNPIAAVLLGLLSGAVVTLGFNYTSKKTRTIDISLESVFIKDRTVATLSSVLPQLVVRLREIGLAPVFVIDELDKVQKLQTRMEKLVRHLKFLVTENSFSCFLTDRRYLNELHVQTSQHAYAREYTYFSDQLVILYRPVELRKFVQNVLESAPADPTPDTQPSVSPATQQELDRVEIVKISYVLLHRARMHPIDLRRHIDNLPAKTKFSMSDHFPLTRSRFETLIQVAIEWLLEGEDIQGSLNGNAYYGLVVYDALYYVSRLWEDAGADKPSVPGHRDFGNAAEKKPGLELDQTKFFEYLQSRSSQEDVVQPPQNGAPAEPKPNSEPQAPLPPTANLGFQGKDFEFLFRKVGELLNYLCKPENLVQKILSSARQVKLDSIILGELPADASVRLLIQDPKNKTHYRWIYDATGRPLQTSKVGEIFDEDFEEAMMYLTESMRALDQMGLTGNLETLALAKVLPRPNVWKTTLLPAMDRLDQLKADANEYANMDVDRATVLECYSTVNIFALNIRAALLMAAFFTPEVTPAQDPLNFKLNFALTRISEILQLAATQDEDLRRLTELMKSLPNDLVRQFNDLEAIGPAVEEWSKKSATGEESAKEIIKSGWEIAKRRFTKRFKAGTIRFDPVFEDVFTALRKVGLGHELAADFSTIPSSTWTRLMLRSLSTDELPAWMRVAAAIELGMLDLAGKLASMTDASAPLSQWVEDARRRASAQSGRHNVVVLAAEQNSLAETWKPPSRHGAIVATALDFTRLLDKLNPYAATLNDYQISLVAIELTSGKQLEQLPTMPPLSVISQMSSNARAINLTILENLIKSVEVCYFVKDLTVSPTSAPGTVKIIGAPKGLDDLIDRVFATA